LPKKLPEPKNRGSVKKPTEEKEWPEEKRGTPEWIEKVRTHESKPWRERPIKLKYKNAIVRQFKYGLTNKEIAAELGCAKDTYLHKKGSNEGKALLKVLEEYKHDDMRIVSDCMHDEAYNSYENLIFARDRLYEGNEYEAAAKIDLKILEAIGFWKKQDVNVNLEGQSITLQFGSGTDIGSLEEGPIIETEYELLPEPEDPSDDN